ncbi:mcfX [Symbiodinium sp. KB8]|nr:mcfX [Symbiodinium sp. KB8]
MVAPEKAIKLGVNDAVCTPAPTPVRSRGGVACFCLGPQYFSADGQVTAIQGMIAGGTAGTVQGVITVPMELVKIRMQCAQEIAPMPAAERAAAALSARAGVAAAHMLPQPAAAASVSSSLMLPHPSLLLSPRAHDPAQAGFFAAFSASAPSSVGADPTWHRAAAVAPSSRPRVMGAPPPQLAHVPGSAIARSSLGPSLPLRSLAGPQGAAVPDKPPSSFFSSLSALTRRLPPSGSPVETLVGRDTPLAEALASLRRGWRVGAEVVNKEGVLALYKAIVPSLMRDLPFGLAFFPLHGSFSALLKADLKMNSFAATLVSGVTVGGACAMAVTPADVIKTRLQLPGGFERYGTTINAFRTVIAEEGARALFRGAVPRGLVLAPTFGLSMGIYEVVRDLYERSN